MGDSAEIPAGFEKVVKTEEPVEHTAGAVDTLESIGQVYPAVETALSFLTQIYGLPAAGLAGLATAGLTRNLEAAKKAQDIVGETLIYSPQTKRGQQLSEAAFYPFIKLHEKSQDLGDWTLKKTNSPTLAAAVATAAEASPMALIPGAKKVFGKKAAVEVKPKAPPLETETLTEQFKERFMKAADSEGGEIIIKEGEKPKLSLVKDIPKGFEKVEKAAEVVEKKSIATNINSIKNKKKLNKIIEDITKVQTEKMDRLDEYTDWRWDIGDKVRHKSGSIHEVIAKEEYNGKPSYILEDVNDYRNTGGVFADDANAYSNFEKLKGPRSLTPEETFVKAAEKTIDLAEAKKQKKQIASDELTEKTFRPIIENNEALAEQAGGWELEFGTKLREEADGEVYVVKSRTWDSETNQGKYMIQNVKDPKDVRYHVFGDLDGYFEKLDGPKKPSKFKETLALKFVDDQETFSGPPEPKWTKEEMTDFLRSKSGTKPNLKKIINKPIKEQGPFAKGNKKNKDESTTLYGGLPLHKFGELYTKHIGEPIWDNLIMSKLPKVMEKIPGGKPVLRAALYDYRGDLPDTPVYMESIAQMRQAQSIGREYGINLGNRLQDLPERSQLTVGDRLRGLDVPLNEIEGQLSVEARNALDSLGKQAVEVGLLDDKVFFENVGKYLPRLYTSKEYQAKLNLFGLKSPNRLEMSRFMKRKDIPAKLRKEYGEIMTPGYPVAKGIVQLTHDIEMAKHFNTIASNPEWALVKEPVLTAEGKKVPFKTITYDPLTGAEIIKQGVKTDYPKPPPQGWEQLPKNKKLGNLSEAYVHPEIAADINAAIKIASAGDRVWKKALGAWKFGKVILSPKTHARNLMSNSLLSHLGGMPLWRQPKLLTDSAIAMKTKGDYWQRAKAEGMLGSTYVEGELKALFDNVEGELKGSSETGLPTALGRISDAWNLTKVGADKAAKLYAAEEQWFKIAKFIDNVERLGMDDKAAAADASKWLFDYSKLTRAQENYRNKWYGAPFATFTIKAAPRIAEAAIKTPWRFAAPAALIYALEEAARARIGDSKETADAKKKLRPEWMQGSIAGIPNFPRVPIQDEHGREYYLNLSYIVPWGDWGESGDVGPIPGGLVPMTQPFVGEAWQQLAGSAGVGETGGYDNFWKEPIVKDSDVAGLPLNERRSIGLKKRGRHLYNTLVPTLVLDIEKGIDSLSGNPDFRGRERPTSVVASDIIGGFKMYPVDYADQMMQQVGKLDPKSSEVGRKIVSEIRTLTVKRNYAAKEDQERRVKKLDKQIATKIRQLQGLGQELKSKGEEYKQIREDTSGIPEGFELKGK